MKGEEGECWMSGIGSWSKHVMGKEGEWWIGAVGLGLGGVNT